MSSDFFHLLSKLQADYSDFIFRAGSRFKFRPQKTIYYVAPESTPRTDDVNDNLSNNTTTSIIDNTGSSVANANGSSVPISAELLLLHELGHAILDHYDFKTAPERLKKEVEAWEVAKKLAQSYHVQVNIDAIELELDSYRDWLHKKSRCPYCSLTRYQTPDKIWHCPYCDTFLRKN